MKNKSAENLTQRTLNEKDIIKLVNDKNYTLAEPILVKIIEVYPDNVWALTALGIVYRSTNRPHAAEACYTRALALKPDNPEVLSNYGNLLLDMDRIEEALQCSERAVELTPDSLVFRKNLAVAQRESKQFEKALANYKLCLKHAPEDPNLMYDVAYVQFYLRNLDEAWEYAEWRFKTNRISLPDTTGIPDWTGENLTGKRLLVLAEQGFGDTILMTRFLPLLTEMGAELVFSCKPPLHQLFEQLPAKLIDLNIKQHGPYDYYVTMMSIPRLTGKKDWLKWPKAAMLNIPDQAVKKFENLAIHASDRLKVGIIWSGSITFAKNDKRSVELDIFLKLVAQHPDIQFYSFQKGPREADIAKHGLSTILPLGHQFEDFSETAAALKHMDCILMTDSAVCHLAGSLEIPVINLLQFMPYWIYYPESHQTPLYPSVRFLQQKYSGKWEAVFNLAGIILGKLSEKKKKSKTFKHPDILKAIDLEIKKNHSSVD
jgi:hypothetical protein